MDAASSSPTRSRSGMLPRAARPARRGRRRRSSTASRGRAPRPRRSTRRSASAGERVDGRASTSSAASTSSSAAWPAAGSAARAGHVVQRASPARRTCRGRLRPRRLGARTSATTTSPSDVRARLAQQLPPLLRGHRPLPRRRRAAHGRRRPGRSTSVTDGLVEPPASSAAGRWTRALMVTRKSRPEIDAMRRAGRIVAEVLDAGRGRAPPGRLDRRPRPHRRAPHPRRRAATPSFKGYPGHQPTPPFPASRVHLDRRRGRPRHPGRAGHPRRARSCRSTPARSSMAGTATARGRSSSATPPAAGRRARRDDPRGDDGRHRGGRARQPHRATSRPPSRTSHVRPGSGSSASSSATASAPRCTRSRRSRTTAPAARAASSRPGMCLAIEPMFTLGGYEARGSRADGWTVVDARRLAGRPLRAHDRRDRRRPRDPDPVA